MKEKNKLPKYKFLSKAAYLLNKGAEKEDLLELAEGYDIDERGVDDYLATRTMSRAVSGALMAGSEEKKAIYNMLDQKLIEEHPDLVIYSRGENVQFYNYNNGVYEPVYEKDVINLVDNVMAQYSLFDYRTSSRNIKDTVSRVKSLLSRTPGRFFDDDSVSSQRWYLNLKNGLLDMRKYELKPHTPEYFSSVQLPFEYNESAECTEFKNFINTVTEGNESTGRMIQEMFGYGIGEGNPKHKVHYLYGDTARNGKSTVAKVLCGLIGWGNVSTLTLSQIAGENSSILTSIVGKQINFADEISSKYVESSRLTAMSAEGIFEINPKFKPAYLCPIKAKFIICCNDLPRFKDAQGMKHRMISIPFSFQIPEGERIDRYDEVLLEKEGAGILNWAIAGAKILQDEKMFTINDQSKEDTHDNIMASNSIYAFLEHTMEFDPSYTREYTTQELYGDPATKDSKPTGFRAFCLNTGISTPAYLTFSKEIRRFANETKKITYSKTRKGSVYMGMMVEGHGDLDEF